MVNIIPAKHQHVSIVIMSMLSYGQHFAQSTAVSERSQPGLKIVLLVILPFCKVKCAVAAVCLSADER